MCLSSCLAAGAVGGAGCQAEPDSAADPSLWDSHGLRLCGGKALKNILSRGALVANCQIKTVCFGVSAKQWVYRSVWPELYCCISLVCSSVGNIGSGSEERPLDPAGWDQPGSSRDPWVFEWTPGGQRWIAGAAGPRGHWWGLLSAIL